MRLNINVGSLLIIILMANSINILGNELAYKNQYNYLELFGVIQHQNGRIDSLINKLNILENRIERRNCLREIGDLYLKNSKSFNEQQITAVQRIIENNLESLNFNDANGKEEARYQLECVWHFAIPALFKFLDNDDQSKFELAAKTLILMRDESIINTIIEKAKRTTIYDERMRYIFILSKMNEQRKSIVPNRNCLSPEQSEALYNRLVIPAIKELKDF